MVQTTWKNHIRSWTLIHISICQGASKTPTIQCSPLLSLLLTNWWRNRTLQPRTRDIPLHLLQRVTPKMARTPPHGWICPQCSCTLGHQQIPILPHYGIWTMILSTPWKNLPFSSQAATQPDWGHTERRAAHKLTQQQMKEWTFFYFKPWKVRDKVWLETRDLKLQVPSRKLSAKWTSPFEITQVIFSIAFWLKLPVMSTMMITTDIFVPTYPWGFFWFRIETWHI